MHKHLIRSSYKKNITKHKYLFYLYFRFVSFSFIRSFTECGKCKADTKRLNLNKFCKRDYGWLSKYFYFINICLIIYLIFFFAAIIAKIIDRDTQTETSNSNSSPTKGKPGQSSTKFSIQVSQVFKKSPGKPLAGAPRRAPYTLLASTQDLECRCPKLKINK